MTSEQIFIGRFYSVRGLIFLDFGSVKVGGRKVAGEGDSKNLEVHSAEQAKIQNVLPKVLATVGKDGWELAGINGPQLYIFKRPIKQ